MDQQRSGAQACFAEGVAHLSAGDEGAALACFERAVTLDADLAEAWANLAWLLGPTGDALRTRACYERSLALRPDLAAVHLNFGAWLMAGRELEEAERHFSQATVLEPAAAGGWSNLGGLYAAWGRDAEAEGCCRQALLRDPDHAMARINLAYVLLRQGRWDQGWPLLEARDWYAALQSRLACPRWRGEPLGGRHILVGPEAGFGDVIQFSRYAGLLRARGAGRITLLCAPPLVPLLATLQGVDEVRSWDLPADPSWDLWVPLLSLPGQMGTQVDSIPTAHSYLQAPDDRRLRWRDWWRQIELLAGSEEEAHRNRNTARVGLVWRGSPGFENDAERSLPGLATLRPLWDVPGVQFVSLQKGAGEDEALHPPAGQELVAAGHLIHDFADTAALIESVDLLITVDTSAAHLAGALGKPCWVLLPAYMTDWRWLQGRDDSPWYPGVLRLFRQSSRADWSPVIAAIARALHARVHGEQPLAQTASLTACRRP